MLLRGILNEILRIVLRNEMTKDEVKEKDAQAKRSTTLSPFDFAQDSVLSYIEGLSIPRITREINPENKP